MRKHYSSNLVCTTYRQTGTRIRYTLTDLELNEQVSNNGLFAVSTVLCVTYEWDNHVYERDNSRPIVPLSIHTMSTWTTSLCISRSALTGTILFSRQTDDNGDVNRSRIIPLDPTRKSIAARRPRCVEIQSASPANRTKTESCENASHSGDKRNWFDVRLTAFCLPSERTFRSVLSRFTNASRDQSAMLEKIATVADAV